jgi:hypothetical protein
MIRALIVAEVLFQGVPMLTDSDTAVN